MGTATNRTYSEIHDPDIEFFGMPVVDITVTFDPIVLGPGRYLVNLAF